MKKILLHSLIISGLMAGNCFAAEAPAQDKQVVAEQSAQEEQAGTEQSAQAEQAKPKGRLQAEKEIWKKGLAAVKKRHWDRKPLTPQELRHYRALDERVGIPIAVAVGLFGVWYAKRRAAYDPKREADELARTQRREEFERLDRERDPYIIELYRHGYLQSINHLPSHIGAQNITAIADIPDFRGMTALMHAAKDGSIGSVKTLLELKADPNIQDQAGMTALMYAASHRHEEIVETLLESGANPDIQTYDNRMTALMIAAREEDANFMNKIFKFNPNIEAKDSRGMTALWHAIMRRNEGAVRALIEEGAEISEGMVSEAERVGLGKYLKQVTRVKSAARKQG